MSVARQPVADPARSASLVGAIGIEDAARAVGVSPSALRLWERQGLVRPGRTRGGQRRYRAEDVSRLREIRRWRAVEGLNAAAIRRLLPRPDRAGVEARPADEAGGHGEASGGQGEATGGHGEASGARGRRGASPRVDEGSAGQERAGDGGAGYGGAGDGRADGAHQATAGLRSLRARSRLTLREAAARSGLSVSFISGLERGLTGASISALSKLTEAYGTTLGELLDEPAVGRLVRPADRRILDTGSGVRIEHLASATVALEPQLFVLEPGASSDGAYSHPGEEFMFVLDGQLSVWLGGSEVYRLGSGDSLTFPSTVAHRFQALGDDETRLIWVNTPPTF